MRILFFSYLSYDNNNYKGGGWVNSLAQLLSTNSNYTIGIAYITKLKDTTPKIINNISYFPIYHNTFLLKKIVCRIFHQNAIIKEENSVNNIVQVFNPDIIQLFGMETLFGSILNQITTKPIVVHIQGICNGIYNKWFPMGISCKATWKYASIKEKILLNTTTDLYKRFMNLLHIEKENFSIYKYYIGRTQWDFEFVSLLSPEAKYYKCNEVMRPEFYNKVWQFKKQETIKLATVMNGELYKGFDTILRTSIILKELGLNFEWNIYGVNEGFSCQKIIERNIHAHFKDNHVYFRGKKEADELIDNMLNSTFYIHTSHIENSSNAICEAMLLGVPTIATYVGGTPSLIENNITGFLVSDSEPYQIAYLINKYAQNKEKLESISKKSFETAQNRHNQNTIIQQLGTIYEEIIKDFHK